MKIGDRIRYREGRRQCHGVIYAIYPSDRYRDADTGEMAETPEHIGVQVDKPLPRWWNWSDTDRFAPESMYCRRLG